VDVSSIQPLALASFESNQSGIETSFAAAAWRSLTEFESNQSGIETNAMRSSLLLATLFESNQSGIETLERLVDSAQDIHV